MWANLASVGLTDLVIIHHGSVVTDWHSAGKDRVNFIFSCTKSVLSAIIGIAIDRHFISSINQPIRDYFPELPELNPDPRFPNITLRHLLTMTSGINWPPMNRAVGMHRQMVASDDWVEFVLKKPLAYEPGVRFNYNDGGSHLLSAVLTRATKMSALAFSYQYLFPFLHISKAKWKENHGVNLGGTGLHLYAMDMAMFGYLYLKGGKIGADQVVSQEWVQESTRIQAEGHPEWFGNYGYHWWVSPQEHNRRVDMFFALGAHGQYIFVIPSKDLVVAVRKKPGKQEGVILPRDLLFEKILPCF
jgi:CubicO group peptidase (beta-lactamase class C family)